MLTEVDMELSRSTERLHNPVQATVTAALQHLILHTKAINNQATTIPLHHQEAYRQIYKTLSQILNRTIYKACSRP